MIDRHGVETVFKKSFIQSITNKKNANGSNNNDNSMDGQDLSVVIIYGIKYRMPKDCKFKTVNFKWHKFIDYLYDGNVNYLSKSMQFSNSMISSYKGVDLKKCKNAPKTQFKYNLQVLNWYNQQRSKVTGHLTEDFLVRNILFICLLLYILIDHCISSLFFCQLRNNSNKDT